MAYSTSLTSSVKYGVVKVDGSTITSTNGVISANGAAIEGAHAYYYSDQLQPNPVASAINTTSWNIDGIVASGVSIDAGTRTQITFLQAGTYSVVFTLSLVKTPGGSGLTDIWLSINDGGGLVDLAYSRQSVVIINTNNPTFVTGNYVLDIPVANTYISQKWSCPEISVSLFAEVDQVGPVRPGIPSARITVTQV